MAELKVDLLKAARAAMKNAYAPYSKFTVGCAVETSAGEIFTGCNVENASYGATLCAERVAISAAVAAGHNKFKKLVLISSNSDPIPPCGLCRQVMVEFFTPNTEILCYGSGGKKSMSYNIGDLMPLSFTAKDLD